MVQNIVIVGGGGAGVATAVALVPKLDPAKHQLVLISERSFHTHMPGETLVPAYWETSSHNVRSCDSRQRLGRRETRRQAVLVAREAVQIWQARPVHQRPRGARGRE